MAEISLQAEGLPESGSVFRRRAARGIAAEQGMLLLIHTDAGDYKFPGGGVEPGETLEQALAREMLEETGRALTGNDGLWGVAHERRPGRTADILEMDSFYFLCRVGRRGGSPSIGRLRGSGAFPPGLGFPFGGSLSQPGSAGCSLCALAGPGDPDHGGSGERRKIFVRKGSIFS